VGDVPYLQPSELEEVTIDGLAGVMIDVDVDPGALAACGSIGGAGVAIFALAGEDSQAQPGERFRLVAVDVEGATVSFLQSVTF